MPERIIVVTSNSTTATIEKKVYTVKEIAQILDVSERHAYNFCNSTTEFDVVKVGRNIRVRKESFDRWFGE